MSSARSREAVSTIPLLSIILSLAQGQTSKEQTENASLACRLDIQ